MVTWRSTTEAGRAASAWAMRSVRRWQEADGNTSAGRQASEAIVRGRKPCSFLLGEREVEAVRQLMMEKQRQAESLGDQRFVRRQADRAALGIAQQRLNRVRRLSRGQLTASDLPKEGGAELGEQQARRQPCMRL